MPDDLHKPYIDDVTFPCAECGGTMRRVPEVIDAWLDSGSMPFAQWHAPFENEEIFEERFPADYICEALDQTRGWFYSLLAVSTLLFGRSPYETVLCLGLILDPEGQKMSKRAATWSAPWDVIERHGADAFRWYYFTSKQPWDGYRFSVETVGEACASSCSTLWNTYGFYVLYANATASTERAPTARALTDLDRWVALAAAGARPRRAIERLDDYDTTSAGRAIAEFVDDLSNWYVRRSRRRFWDGDPAAFATLRECLVTVAKLLAPLTPFVADEIYDEPGRRRAVGAPVRLPGAGRRRCATRSSSAQMAVARDAVELGPRRARAGKVKVRQPLREAVVVAADRERAAIERFDDARARRAEREGAAVRLRGRRAGPLRAQAQLPRARVRGSASGCPRWPRRWRRSTPRAPAATLREGGRVAVSVDGTEHALGADDVQLVLQPLEGYQVERAGTHAVALNLELDDELRREGLAREVVHAVQNARKARGPATWRTGSSCALGGDGELLDAVRAHEGYVTGETLATSLEYDGAEGAALAEVGGRRLLVRLERAG